MTGNGMARLRQAVGPAAEDAVLAAANSWYEGAAQIYHVVRLLEEASPVIAEQLGPRSGPAAARAFAKMSERLEVRRQQMDDAGTALVSAQQTIVAGRETLKRLEAQAITDPGTFTPDPRRDEVGNLKAMRDHHAQVSAYRADLAAQDAEANRAADEMDRTFTDSSETMKRIHGEPDRSPGGGGSGSTPGGSTPPSGGGGRSPAVHPGDPGDRGSGGGGRGDGPGRSDHLDLPPTDGGDTPSTTIGLPQGPTGTPGATIGSPATTPGGSVPAAAPGGATLGGVAGAIGGGVIGGAAGIAGAVRGGSVPVATTAAGSGSAPRAIGSTTRTGASSTLGRSTSPATGAASPGAGGAATGGRATGTSAGSAGSAGSPARGAGAPGGRGGAGRRGAGVGGRAATGAGVAGRAASRRDEEKKGRQEFYEDTRDWVDDEDAAPGVID